MSLPPGVVTFGPDATCTLDTCPIEWSVYGYRPSLAANITFVVLFGLGGVVHAVLGFKRKTWWFICCMIVCSMNACIGYGGRVWLWYDPFSFEAFLMQMICITTGPVYYCAATYVILGQTIAYFSPTISRLKPAFFYFGFGTCDIISLALQAAGGAMSSSSAGSSDLDTNLALAGLAFQVATIFTFCSFLFDFIIRYFRSPQGRIAISKIGSQLKLFFGFMFLAMFLTVVRSVYRLVELREGYSGDLIKEEPLFIALEGV
ncbi:RTA1 like protein-domain-containing protein [Whalleya microplaca]|nr:RTA1 like protein-domain-containing protein [Whalleya microplaca]